MPVKTLSASGIVRVHRRIFAAEIVGHEVQTAAGRALRPVLFIPASADLPLDRWHELAPRCVTKYFGLYASQKASHRRRVILLAIRAATVPGSPQAPTVHTKIKGRIKEAVMFIVTCGAAVE